MLATYRPAISIGLRKSVNEILAGHYRIYGYPFLKYRADGRFSAFAAIPLLEAGNRGGNRNENARHPLKASFTIPGDAIRVYLPG